MHSFWIFFLKNRAFTFMIMGALTSVGLYSSILIPKESAPEVIIPVGIVSTALRGGSAEDVEKLVTNVLEQEIANVENIDKVTSSSREGVSVISAQFLANANIEKSIQDLKDAVDKGVPDLPDDATTPTVSKINFSDQPFLIVSVSQDTSPAGLTTLGEDLKRELKKVKGVSKVEVTGTREKEVQVVVRKAKLTQYNLSLPQVISALQSGNASLPVGRITVSDIDYPIKFAGSIDEASMVPDIPLESPAGTIVYLRDVAYVTDGLQAPSTYSRVSENGKPSENALTLSVFKKSGGNVTTIAKATRAKLESLQNDLLQGASVVVSLDTGELVEKDMSELSKTGLETVTLVMIVLFLTIGWREAVVAGLSIPLSFVIAFIGLNASGNTINFLSLFSLILAIGILVDSGIVVAEAIHTRIKKLGSVEEAAHATIHEYSWPLIAGTMTTVAVFFPLFFLSGIVGKFIQSIPFTIIFVLIASIFVALGMVPILATLLSSRSETKNRFTELQEEWFHRTQEWYKQFLGNILTHRSIQNKFLIVLIGGFIFSLTLIPLGLVKVELFPQDDQDFIILSVEKPEGSTLVSTDVVVRQIEEVLYEEPVITAFVTTVGASSALLDNNGGGANTKLANITIILDKNRTQTSTEVVEQLRTKFTSFNTAIVKVGQGNNGPPTGKPVVIKFKGDDMNALSAQADSAERILQEVPGTTEVETSLRDNGTQIEISIDRAKAMRYGLTTAQVAQILRTSVSGTAATTIKKQGEDIDILVKLDLNEEFVNPEDTIRTTLDSIKSTPVVTQKGTVLLGSILETSLVQSRASIAHEEQKRVVTVSADTENGVTPLEVMTAFQKHASELNTPEGVQIDYGGDTEEINNTFRDMILALVAGLSLMLAILVLEFDSFRYSFYLLMAVPLSLIGVFAGLAITGLSFSFSAMLGYIALAGVIINHAIILLDSILHRLEHEKEAGSNATLFDVIIESSAVRLRPIVLTTVTTVVGMIPLIGVSALWGPLAVSIMFGLAFAMLLTLVLIPMFFYRYPGKRYRHMKNESHR